MIKRSKKQIEKQLKTLNISIDKKIHSFDEFIMVLNLNIYKKIINSKHKIEHSRTVKSVNIFLVFISIISYSLLLIIPAMIWKLLLSGEQISKYVSGVLAIYPLVFHIFKKGIEWTKNIIYKLNLPDELVDNYPCVNIAKYISNFVNGKYKYYKGVLFKLSLKNDLNTKDFELYFEKLRDIVSIFTTKYDTSQIDELFKYEVVLKFEQSK
ncbi:hypothetical protein [Mycoplasma sp. Mirounga ES2805-ORL]|uniref:hypothetical protein n=1 Tax=Mycoplasma sp. Mirounga ES2805-ORL TaxID=754514 RepID=UPI00197B2A6A|nr:hypothetical protein [Mycoplasma sp. Mirounga ES2805-ORL]QSF13418.1 hypothetical protein JXZ90_01945 [Mycoplasma sp. Mirounga ES2805-ORL]